MKRAILAALRTRAGQRIVNGIGTRALALSTDLAPSASLRDAERLPERIDGFEDLSFLFTSTPAAYGIAQLTIEEAAYLYRTAARTRPGTIVEIGRFRGGSTLVLAAALPPESRLVSYDLHIVEGVDGKALDSELGSVLSRLGLADRVDLVVGDSADAARHKDMELAFIDGDHSFEGVLADYTALRPSVRSGGHLLFHDVPWTSGSIRLGCAPVGRAVDEIARRAGSDLQFVAQAGSVAHFTCP